MQENLPHKRFLEGCSSPFMPLAEHLTSLRALVLAMSARSVKTQRAPSRHCRDARAYGHTTTAMHDNKHTNPTYPHLSIQPFSTQQKERNKKRTPRFVFARLVLEVVSREVLDHGLRVDREHPSFCLGHRDPHPCRACLPPAQPVRAAQVVDEGLSGRSECLAVNKYRTNDKT